MKLTREAIVHQERVSAAEFTRKAQAAARVGDVGREAEMSLAADMAMEQVLRLEGMAA